jgi:hypothetical protein
MGLHLAEISARVAADAHAVVVLDQAGWHMAGPCCTDQRDGRIDPHARPGSCDADGLRASEL